jgi:hypothetical protein
MSRNRTLLPVLALLSALALPTAPALAQGGLPQITLPGDLDADAVERYTDKLDAYAQLLAGTSRTVTNALRYLKNFDLKSGPKGTERSTYDLVDLNANLYADLVRKARAAAAEEPAIAELDKAALDYADAVATNPAVFNEAAQYYSGARRYELDRYEHGKVLHPKIAREIERFFATLPPFMGFLHQVRGKIDSREITIVEQAGRAPARALARKLMIAGRTASLFVHTNASRDMDLAGFDAALKAYLDLVASYKAYRAGPGKGDASLSGITDMRVEGLARELREIRAAYETRRQVPLRYELLLLPFYEHHGRFWSELLGVVERNPWTQARAPVTVAALPRVLPPVPAASVDDVDRDALVDWAEKNEAALALLVETNALMTAWNAYVEWVDQRRGPSGKEKGIAFGSIDRARLATAAGQAREFAGLEPRIGALDELLRRYADAVEAVMPIAVEASGYYERKDFLTDQMKTGKALHPRIMSDYRPFLEARTDLSLAVRGLRDRLEEKELALIEQADGKSPQWHRLKLLLMARALQERAPRIPNPLPGALQDFDAAVAEFAAAVKALEAVADAESGKFVKEANQYVGKLRRLRQEYGQPTMKFTLEGSLSSLVTTISMMTQAARNQ